MNDKTILKRTFTAPTDSYKGSYTATAKLYQIGNRRPYFSVTSAHGADHENILKHFPELGPVVALHLCEEDGAPMHAEANALYWATQGGIDTLAKHLRISEDEARALVNTIAEGTSESDKKAIMHAYIAGLRPRWKTEADEAKVFLSLSDVDKTSGRAPKKRTIKSFTDQTNIPEKLCRAVINQLGGWEEFQESAPDIANNGIDGGSGGFTYYEDTVSFARKHKTLILELAKAQAEGYGEPSAYVMMSHFNCFKQDADLTADRIAEIINSRFNADDCDYTTVFNGLAWYAGEEVARAYNDLLEQE